MNSLEKLGIRIGHYTNKEALTGATVIIPDNGADIGIDIRGSNTGTINIPAFEIKSAARSVQAIVLSGGSTPGLECSIGVMDYLTTPNVVGAVIYDRHVGKDERPHLDDGIQMTKTASYDDLSQGNVGVGSGATVGKLVYKNRMKGGFGISIKEISDNVFIGAFVVTNSMGDIINPDTKEFYSKCGNYKYENYYTKPFDCEKVKYENTTLAVIVTNVEMNREELMKVSEIAHDGMSRAIYPVHTNWDGDIIFSISPHSLNRVKLKGLESFHIVNYIGVIASNILIEAINNSIKNATSIDNYKCYRDIMKQEAGE